MKKGVKGLVLFVLFALFFLLVNSAESSAYTKIGNTYYCDNCSDCNSSIINSSTGDVIALNQSIINHTEKICMQFNSKTNVSFNGQGNLIDGTDVAPGEFNYGIFIYNSDKVTIKNCTVSDFFAGIGGHTSIDFLNVTNVTLFSNSLYGIHFGASVKDSSFINISAYENNVGFAFGSGFSQRNLVANSTFTNNTENDFSITSNTELCNNSLVNVTGSGNLPIRLYNSSTVLENQVLSELVLCSANNSIIRNVTIRGSDTIKNNGIYMYFTGNITFSDINSSENYYGLYSFYSMNFSISNSVFNSNNRGPYLEGSTNVTLSNVSANSNSVIGVTTTHLTNKITLKDVTANLNGQYGFAMQASNISVYNSTFQENTHFDIFNTECKHDNLLQNVTGSGDRVIAYYNSSVNLQDLVFSELMLCGADGSNLTNITIHGSDTLENNMFLIDTTNSNFSNINSSFNKYGIYVHENGVNNTFTDIIVNNNQYGITAVVPNNFTNVTANNNDYGIDIWYWDFTDSGALVKDSHMENNSIVGLQAWSYYNLIYNNFLNNTVNWINYDDDSTVSFNTTKTSGTNIVGGSYLGGNYWAYPNGTGFSETCTDADDDGICDLPYLLQDAMDSTDYLPLYLLSQSCTESWTCTDWSTCSSGTQTRTCTDSNSCGTTTSKPIESQSCEEGRGSVPVITNATNITPPNDSLQPDEEECIPNEKRCLDNQIQSCSENKNWAISETCEFGCENGQCISEKPGINPIILYPVIGVAVVGILASFLIPRIPSLKILFKK